MVPATSPWREAVDTRDLEGGKNKGKGNRNEEPSSQPHPADYHF